MNILNTDILQYYKDNKKLIYSIALILVIGTISVMALINHMNKAVAVANENQVKPSLPPVEKITVIGVHIKGSVQQPGFYNIEEGARLIDLINAAGGITPYGDLDSVNLAQYVVDGGEYYVSSYYETTLGVGTGGKSAPSPSQKIDINSADQATLEQLPGVGPATAKAIIAYREKNQGFEKIEDIMKVKGISSNKFEDMKDMITAQKGTVIILPNDPL